MASETKTYIVPLIIEVRVTVTNPDVIERVTGHAGDEWRKHLYDLRTRDDVLTMLADNAFRNDIDRARALDGWADLPDAAATMEVLKDNCQVDLDLYPIHEKS
jgi:hypothetical protein